MRLLPVALLAVISTGCFTPSVEPCGGPEDCGKDEVCELGLCLPAQSGAADASIVDGSVGDDGRSSGDAMFVGDASACMPWGDVMLMGGTCPPAGSANVDLMSSMSNVITFNSSTLSLTIDGVAQTTTAQDFGFAVVWPVGTFQLRSNNVLRLIGAKPVVIAATGDIIIDGTIDASSSRSGAAPGVGAGADDPTCSTSSGTVKGGGPGGSLAQVGGSGGSGGAGVTQASAAVSPSQLTLLRGGCPGGSGKDDIGATGGSGGNGGGGVLLVGSTIIVSQAGRIFAGGGGGGGGLVVDLMSGGGGGGSGGVIALQAATIDIDGGIFANGAGGGGGAATTNGGNGGDATMSMGGEGGPGGAGAGAGGKGGSGQDPATDGASASIAGGGGGGSVGYFFYRAGSITTSGSMLSPGAVYK